MIAALALVFGCEQSSERDTGDRRAAVDAPVPAPQQGDRAGATASRQREQQPADYQPRFAMPMPEPRTSTPGGVAAGLHGELEEQPASEQGEVAARQGERAAPDEARQRG